LGYVIHLLVYYKSSEYICNNRDYVLQGMSLGMKSYCHRGGWPIEILSGGFYGLQLHLYILHLLFWVLVSVVILILIRWWKYRKLS